MEKIPFNKPYVTGKETHYIYDAVYFGQVSGNGKYTQKCHSFFRERYGFHNCLLTTSCGSALHMAAILLDIRPGDEVIMPSYTFVSTANAFAMRGGRIRFADSRSDHPNMDENRIEELITEKTKAIVVVHYAGISCDMDTIMDIARKHKLYVIEDAAHAIESKYVNRNGTEKVPGSIGHLAAFSFHETKNIISGEGGLLVINDQAFAERARTLWDKGTNRAAFFKGDVDKYEWVDLGLTFAPSDITAAFLYAQLEEIESVQERRKRQWNFYSDHLRDWALKHGIQTPVIPGYAKGNYHLFYLVFNNQAERDRILQKLEKRGIHAVFHYQSLHRSKYYSPYHDGRELPNADRYSGCLLRLPLFFELKEKQLRYITETLTSV